MDKNTKYSIPNLGKAFLDSYKAFREATQVIPTQLLYNNPQVLTGLYQTTNRPIIFIGHSLGGLLIKEARTTPCPLSVYVTY